MGKRGPKRQKGKREPNGQLSRRLEDQAVRAMANDTALDLAAREVVALGVAARSRVHKVSLDAGIDQMAGSYVGRLKLAGVLTYEQYHAAVMFAQEAANYAWACAAPREPGAIDLNATRGGAEGRENVTRTVEAYALYESSRKAVQKRQNELRLHSHLYAALQYLVINDIELEHLVDDLKEALTVLALHYGLVKPEKPKKTLEVQTEAA